MSSDYVLDYQEKEKSFENYLQEQHIKQRSWVLDDDLPDDFDRWLTDLQIDEVIAYAEAWGKELQHA